MVGLLLFLLVSSQSLFAAGRDTIWIVGSSTVYPFTTVVAERFGRSGQFPTPKVESTGTGGGFKLFCGGIGVNFPDLNDASRRIKRSEFDRCREKGVQGIVEIKIGYDGIVVASSRKAPIDWNLSRRHLFLALAKQVPDPKRPGRLIPNPYRRWQEIDPDLPDLPIKVYGPPPTSGTRDAFVELAMEGGCNTFDWIARLEHRDKKRYKAICHAIREDGAWIDAGENDNLVVQKLTANPDALGIFGFSYLDQNRDKIKGAQIDGVEPTFENIASGSYPISRPLFIYVKKAHVGLIPGIPQFLEEYTSERAWGEEGYLTERGLIPMPEAERKRYREIARKLIPLKRDELTE